MAREAPYLPCPLLLVLLALGTWAQNMEFWKLEEGETLSVSCEHQAHDRGQVKAWCQVTLADVCHFLVTSQYSWDPRYSIRDLRLYSFEVTMAGLRVKDTGFYWCGFLENGKIRILKIVRLLVSKALTPRTPRSTQRTVTLRAPASATSPATDSPSGWKSKGVVVGVVVGVLLLLGLSVLTGLCLRRARGGARNGERGTHRIYENFPGPKESADFEQPVPSDQDVGTIHYASLIHLSPSGTKDPTDSDSRFLSVEYADIAGRRPQPSAPPALDEQPGS